MNKTKAQEANASEFRALMQMPAWSKLIDMVDSQIFTSMKLTDDVAAADLNINKVCDERGFRRGLRWVMDQVSTKAEIG